jgi:NAD(P)-dependent dehydrogenase (short-subunit alcohol dehydrogenase family)
METLTGRVALVTGGSRGIGLAIARALIARGVRTAITGRNNAQLAAARAELEGAKSGAVEVLRADARSAADAEGAVEKTVARFGGLDVLVNNAGVGVFSNVEAMTPGQWSEIIDTNLTGVFYMCHAAIPHLRRQGGGFILNISSLAGTNPFAGGAAYCASKAGLNAFTEALMQEVRYDNIRVACVAPGSVDTGFSGAASTSAQWKIAPEDIGELVLDLLTQPPRSLVSRVEMRPTKPKAGT